MKICHIVASINENIGGPAYSVSKLVDHLSQHSQDVTLASLDYEEHGKPLSIGNASHLHPPVSKLGRYFRGWSPELYRMLSEHLSSGCDVLHSHGLWMVPNLYARKLSQRYKIPLVISPRGMLERWSLGKARWKKYGAWMVYEKANLLQATAFHATSEMELESIRALGFRQPVAVIPNGVDLPQAKGLWKREQVDDFFPQLRGKRILLFLSRLDPKKGVRELLDVWKGLSVRFPDWHLVLAGPDLVGMRGRLEEFVSNEQLGNSVTFTGMISGAVKDGIFSAAELFVLPSHSENFGNVVTESLAYGIPVITTTGTPWSLLQEYECGWWIELKSTFLIDTLREALSSSSQCLAEKGNRGKRLIGEVFDWAKLTGQMEEFYSWMSTQGNPPAFVEIE
ncbi:MAG: glycosyltransferase [Bdellovibrionales bacterium]|nr:glycosyltransferase [Bdellovibrionales bacterium]